MRILAPALAALILSLPALAAPERRVEKERPADFVDLADVDPTIRVDLIYLTPDNFVGRPIRGYLENRCFLVKPAAEGLKRAQARLQKIALRAKRDYTLLVRDCYRPHKATQDFLAWVDDPTDLKQKQKFYPLLSKSEIVSKGYLSAFSGHSRGSTVDLTIAEPGPNGELQVWDMGQILDFFGEVSHTDSGEIDSHARAGRRLLKKVMSPEFSNYEKEWWHYSLRNEPYPRTAFDFDVAREEAGQAGR